MSAEPQQTAYEQLTEKQRAFVDALCLEPNISTTKAAETAGYAKKSAHVEGSRLLRHAKVRKALGEQLKDVAPTAAEIAVRWDRVSRGSLADFYSPKRVEVPTKVRKPLYEVIAELEARIQFEAKVAARSNLSEKEQKVFDTAQLRRGRELIRLHVEFEEDPEAFREVAGPPGYEEVLELDLVKAHQAGVLDLARAIKPTQYGIGIELRDPDAALDKLARMAGAYEKDNEQGRAVVALHAVVEVVPAVADVPLAGSEKEVDDV